MAKEIFSWYTLSDSLTELQEGLRLAKESNAQSLLILTCEQNHYPEESLNTVLKGSFVTLFGGIYPMITFKDTLLKKGALIVGFTEIFDIQMFSNMNLLVDEDTIESTITEGMEQNAHFFRQNNFWMFYDGLLGNVEDFVDCLFECLDHRINIAGGGAGCLDFIQRPCIFTNEGLHADVIMLVSLPKHINVGVGHGWKAFQGPFLVSESNGPTVQSLNYQPAFELYKQTIEAQGEYIFDSTNFFDIAKNFPLGIEDINNNLIVRDPIVTQDNNLQCVGNVPINSMVYLLAGDTQTLVASAEEAAITSFSSSPETISTALVFDCISRVLYMEEDFDKELGVISKHCPTPSLFGVLSLGEIVNSSNGAIRLLNKSIVISSW